LTEPIGIEELVTNVTDRATQRQGKKENQLEKMLPKKQLPEKSLESGKHQAQWEVP